MNTPQKSWQERFVKTFFVYKLGGKFPDHVGAEKEAVAFIQELIKEEKLGLLERVQKQSAYLGLENGIGDNFVFTDDILAIKEEIKKGEL